MLKNLLVLLTVISGMGAGAYEYFLESGDYRIRINEKYKHTIREVVWKKHVLATQTGYYGAILCPAAGKYIGAGHKEGGAEKLLSVKVTCDGKEVTPAAKAVFKGSKVTVEKLSMFDKLLFRVLLEVTPEGLVETKRFVATADQKVHLYYAHIYCFGKNFTDYYALSDKNKVIAGKFELPRDNPKSRKTAWKVNSNVKYVAEYDAAKKIGVMLWYPEIIKGASRKATIWECPWAYMKFYMMTALPKNIPSAWESPTYTVILRGLEAATLADFPAAVQKEAAAAEKIKFTELTKPVMPEK